MDKLETFLHALSLNDDEIHIYLALVQTGPLTVLELSRQTSINRTRVYRTLEHLQAKGILEMVVDEYRQLAKAADASTLEVLVSKQEIASARLRSALPDITRQLSDRASSQDPHTRVLYHKGINGIKNSIWHTLQAKGTVYAYTCRPLDEIAGRKFAERWQDEIMARKITFLELYSDELLSAMRGGLNERIDRQTDKTFISKYVPASLLNINLQVDIYNDVVAYYSWNDNEIFGVELHNQKVADLQKQLFLHAWNSASLATQPGDIPLE